MVEGTGKCFSKKKRKLDLRGNQKNKRDTDYEYCPAVEVPMENKIRGAAQPDPVGQAGGGGTFKKDQDAWGRGNGMK